MKPSVRVYALSRGESMEADTSGQETAVVPLSGEVHLEVGDTPFERVRRVGRVAQTVWAPPGARTRVTAFTDARIAVANAPSSGGGPPFRVSEDEAVVERRGTGSSGRLVHTLIGPDSGADRLIVGETFSDGGIWSSYPPHRHDREDPPHERQHAECFLVTLSPPGGFAVMITYDEDGADESARVLHDGDIVEVESGFHSFAVADGYELSYLWILAGRTRDTLFRTDTRHRWLLEPTHDGV